VSSRLDSGFRREIEGRGRERRGEEKGLKNPPTGLVACRRRGGYGGDGKARIRAAYKEGDNPRQ